MVHAAFLFFTQEFFEFFVCLFWCASFHYSHPIHHTVNMCIDTDKGHTIEMREDDLCRLHADSWKCTNSFEGVGNFSAVFVHELFCCHEEVLRFDSIIVHASEHDLDFLGLELQEVGRSFYQLEEPLCCFVHSFICHLCREHDSHEELKWAREIELNSLGWVELENFIQDRISFCFCPEFHRCIVCNFSF